MRDVEVLVVEDEPLSRDVMERLLRSRGFRVESVTDGPQCLERLERRTPDLVLLDVSMPGMSGLDVLRCIRRDHSHDRLPVILVTALVDSDDVVAGLEAGANDYVVKPVNLPVLLARMGVALQVKRGVERLMEAERHRVMLESIDRACDGLVGPVDDMIGELEGLASAPPTDAETIRGKLEAVLDWAHQMKDLIAEFKKIAGYRSAPYTEGLGSFVAASLERAGGSAERARDQGAPDPPGG